MQPLIQITRLRGVERQLARIAHCFETYLRLAYNYHVTAPKADTSGPDASVEYYDDREALLQEVEQIAGRTQPDEED